MLRQVLGAILVVLGDWRRGFGGTGALGATRTYIANVNLVARAFMPAHTVADGEQHGKECPCHRKVGTHEGSVAI